MSETTNPHNHHHHAHVVVHSVEDTAPPYRRVDILGTQVGQAYALRDVVEFCRRVGLEDLDIEAPGSVQWIGGGAHTWDVRPD